MQNLLPPPNAEMKMNPETGKTEYIEDDDDEDFDSIFSRLPTDIRPLIECMLSSKGCLLLLVLKDHIKETYGITDA